MVLIWIILVLAFILRINTIGQSLWLDEAIGALAAKNLTYSQILTGLMSHDNHPPLYYLLLKSWTTILGYSEVSLRMPSVLFGVGTIYLTYLIANEIAPKKKFVGLFSCLFLALSQFHIYYSQEARMYSMAGFFAALAIYAFQLTLKKQMQRYAWILFSASIVTMMFSDYMPIFLLPVFFIAGHLYRKDRKWWNYFLGSFIPLGISGFIWLPYLKMQMESGTWLVSTWPDWKKVAGGATFNQAALVWMKFVFGRISLNNKFLYYGIVILSSIPFAVSLFLAWIHKRKEILLIWLWFCVPLGLGFVASFFFPAFIYFRFTYILPAFYILVAYGLLQIKKDRVFFLLIAAVLLIEVVSYRIYTTNVSQQREQWREAVAFVEDNAKDSEIALFEFPEPFAPYQWYATGKIEAKGATDSINANPENTESKTTELIGNKESIYYFEYLRELSDPEDTVRFTIEENGFSKKETYNFAGVGLVHYYGK